MLHKVELTFIVYFIYGDITKERIKFSEQKSITLTVTSY